MSWLPLLPLPEVLPSHLPVGFLTSQWRPGSYDHHPGHPDEPWTWLDEIVDLIATDGPAFAALINSIRLLGVQPNEDEPVLLGRDRRVWGGHHRICAALIIGEGAMVPVELGVGAEEP